MAREQPVQPTPQEAAVLRSARVGHLATADGQGQPYLVPVCFAYDGSSIYTATDAKPKTTSGHRLKRVRNIQENPRVAVMVDHYEEDWGNLYYVLVLGRTELVEGEEERGRALALLREKYPQYREMDLEEDVVIRITPRRVRSWGRLPRGSG